MGNSGLSCAGRRNREMDVGAAPAPDYSYVGNGRGKYIEVQQLVYVGEGKGSFNVDGTKNSGGSGSISRAEQTRTCILVTMVALLSLGAVSLVVSLISGPKNQADSIMAASRQTDTPLIPVTGVSSNPRFSCLSQRAHWTAKQKQWCCEERGIGCPHFDCKAGAFNWQREWSVGKQEWCCTHFSAGCHDPGEASVVGLAAPASEEGTASQGRDQNETTPQALRGVIPYPSQQAASNATRSLLDWHDRDGQSW